jgi:hypothetical protein
VIAAVAGLVVLGGAIALLRNGTPPQPPESVHVEQFVDQRVDYRADDRQPSPPAAVTLTSLHPTSLRVSWTGNAEGYEVRWGGRVRYVHATQTELTGLDPGARTSMEIRAVTALGRRSAPAHAEGVPREVYDEHWAADLSLPLDRFDGPESLDPRRWRIHDRGNADCLGLRALGTERRLEINCESLDMQSNVPLRLGAPTQDGAVGRALLVTDGPTGSQPGGSLAIVLLPDPFQDLPMLQPHVSGPGAWDLPPGAVALRIGQQGAHIDVGPGVPTTSHAVPPINTSVTPTPGVRHRWELRVLPDAVLGVRDGEVVTASAVAMPWTLARPRLVFSGVAQTLVDTFATGRVPNSPEPASIVELGPSTGGSAGAVADQLLEGAVSVRVVASVVGTAGGPITVGFGSRSAPARLMYPDRPVDQFSSNVIYADFALPDANPGHVHQVLLKSDSDISAYAAHVVVTEGPASPRRPLPRTVERGQPEPRVAQPALTVTDEPGHRAHVVLELNPDARSIAGVAGIEFDLDGERILTLPTALDGPAVGGHHEFRFDTSGLRSGSHRLSVRVRPERAEVAATTTEADLRRD